MIDTARTLDSFLECLEDVSKDGEEKKTFNLVFTNGKKVPCEIQLVGAGPKVALKIVKQEED